MPFIQTYRHSLKNVIHTILSSLIPSYRIHTNVSSFIPNYPYSYKPIAIHTKILPFIPTIAIHNKISPFIATCLNSTKLSSFIQSYRHSHQTLAHHIKLRPCIPKYGLSVQHNVICPNVSSFIQNCTHSFLHIDINSNLSFFNEIIAIHYKV